MDSNLLTKTRQALRITTTEFDGEIGDLGDAAMADLGIAGVIAEQDDPLITRAVITYVKMNFGDVVDDYDRLKASYDEQKAQLSMATGYTIWEGE